MENEFFKFHRFEIGEYSDIISIKEGEKKIGENLIDNNSFKGKYVILGIEEDFGPKKNFGKGGSNNTFKAFLQYFLNRQSNEHLEGKEFLIYGSIRPKVSYEEVKDNSKIIEYLDDIVFDVVSKLIKDKYIPIIIGGGHNNAYPIIKATNFLYKSINVINFDAHADLRFCDYRHSGNPFSWAFKENILDSYTVLGLHKQYNNQFIIDNLKNEKIKYSYFEEYLFEERKIKKDIKEFIKKFKNHNVGIEIDMDSVENFPSSAISPFGFTLKDIRINLKALKDNLSKICYFHISESSPISIDEQKYVGKALTYLVSDLISI